MNEVQGFYREKARLEREADDSELLDFGFLENEAIRDNNDVVCQSSRSSFQASLADFLHGFCDIFACRLSKTYGYKVENIYGDDGHLVHAYCITKDGEFVDVRGKTADRYAFFAEFEDWLDISALSLYRRDNTVKKIETDEDKEWYKYAKCALQMHPSYYCTTES